MVKRLKRQKGLPLPKLPKPFDRDEVEAALARMKGTASDEDYAMLRAVVDADPLVRAELETTHDSIIQLRRLLKKKRRASWR